MAHAGQPMGELYVIQKALYTPVPVVQYDSIQNHSLCFADLCLAIWLVREYYGVSQMFDLIVAFN